MFNAYIRGWIQYYGQFYKSALYETLRRVDVHLIKWACRKYRTLRCRARGTVHWFMRVVRTSPGLFAHWQLLYATGRMSGAG